MIYIVTKCAEIHIVFNKNDQAIYLNLFELIEDQVTKDGCSKLSMSVDWIIVMMILDMMNLIHSTMTCSFRYWQSICRYCCRTMT